MAEYRIRAVSIALWLTLVVVGVLFLANAAFNAGPGDYLGVLTVTVAWAAAIAIAHLLTVPTPSGAQVSLGIGPAVAASILITDAAQLAAIYAIGMAGAWVARRISGRFDTRTESEFLSETISMAVYGVVAFSAMEALANTMLDDSWQAVIAVAAGAVTWFLVRAFVAALVGLEREDLSARYLWLLALEDWSVVVSVFSAGALFGLAFPVMGWWALPVAVMPYAFSHLAFVRYHSTKITYGQTIRALAQIPEVAGLAPGGHATRTADYSIAIARELGLHPNDVAELEYAALMHDVGRITLSEPAILKAGYTDEDLARWGAQIIAEAPYLSHVAELVEQQYEPYRTPGVEIDPDVPTSSKIIKVASAYDQSVNEDHLSPIEALEEIHRGSAYDFDPRIGASLRRVLSHRGLIAG